MICEINDGIENYTYDTTIYTITFDVRDVAGQLVADKRVEKEDGTVVDEAIFTNVYKAPLATPKTSDQNNNLLLYAMIMIVSLLVVIFTKHKKQTYLN